MSMSMPSTCTKPQGESVISQTRPSKHERMQHLIPRILMPLNHTHVKQYCLESLERICLEYHVSMQHNTVCNIRNMVHHESCSYMKAIALFFLLLNVDSQMKKCIIESESQAQQNKCSNFFMNLRRHIVPQFMSSEATEMLVFTTQCRDMWTAA
jgi:hypothetical protein